jgi:deferrochelatase/peroxidase EfeB
MPKTEGDIIIHVKAKTYSLCFETGFISFLTQVQSFVKCFPSESILKVEDNYGFEYKDGRDLSGFLDGIYKKIKMKRNRKYKRNEKQKKCSFESRRRVLFDPSSMGT